MKRGFSRMLWGGVILLVVLFFVSVYGVKEGFKCVAGNTYSLPTITTTRTSNDTLSGCLFNDCRIANPIATSKFGLSGETCAYGSPDETGNLTKSKGYFRYLDTTVTPNIYKWQA